jgi:hypothetical protein
MPVALRVTPWPDPVLDVLGHDPRSWYAETYTPFPYLAGLQAHALLASCRTPGPLPPRGARLGDRCCLGRRRIGSNPRVLRFTFYSSLRRLSPDIVGHHWSANQRETPPAP